jgi:hypothetical protein
MKGEPLAIAGQKLRVLLSIDVGIPIRVRQRSDRVGERFPNLIFVPVPAYFLEVPLVPNHDAPVDGIERFDLEDVSDDAVGLWKLVTPVAQDLHFLIDEHVPVALVRPIRNVRENLVRGEDDLGGSPHLGVLGKLVGDRLPLADGASVEHLVRWVA